MPNQKANDCAGVLKNLFDIRARERCKLVALAAQWVPQTRCGVQLSESMQEAGKKNQGSTMPSFVEAPQEVVVGGSGSGVVPPSRSLVGGVVGGSSHSRDKPQVDLRDCHLFLSVE